MHPGAAGGLHPDHLDGDLADDRRAPPVLHQSTVAPPNGSISEDHGALAVSVQNGQGQGIGGVGLTGSGAGSFSGTTGANGCVIFGNLPEGNYTLTPVGSTGLVDRDGNPPGPCRRASSG